MTLKYRWLGCVAMSGALGATQAYGRCEQPSLPEGVPGYSVCKEWPAYDGQTITALSQIEPDPTLSDAPDGTGMYDLKLAVVSNIDGKPLAALRPGLGVQLRRRALRRPEHRHRPLQTDL